MKSAFTTPTFDLGRAQLSLDWPLPAAGQLEDKELIRKRSMRRLGIFDATVLVCAVERHGAARISLTAPSGPETIVLPWALTPTGHSDHGHGAAH